MKRFLGLILLMGQFGVGKKERREEERSEKLLRSYSNYTIIFTDSELELILGNRASLAF